MRMFVRYLLVLLVIIPVACGKVAGYGEDVAEPLLTADKASAVSMDLGGVGAAGFGRDFANLPDHGDLVAYPGKVVRNRGAYTWHRAAVSEAHALHAIKSGYLRVTTPQGAILDFKYDRSIEHPSGDWTWVGHLPGQERLQTIITFGSHAAFGSIAQPVGPPLRLTARDGAAWLVETDADKVAPMPRNASGKPERDYRLVPASALPAPMARESATKRHGPNLPVIAGATVAGTTSVGLIAGYTTGFSAANGGVSSAMTRLNYLVDVTNISYANSGIDAALHLVTAISVNYTDSNSSERALQELTGYDPDTQQQVPPSPAFNELRAAREQYGADLVTLVRDFRTPENEGCGIAWLLGGGLGGLAAIQDSEAFGYSVVNDGNDIDEGDNATYYCLDETLAHELGHNMGAAHDRETSKGDDGVLDNPDDYGAFSYSFGYKTSSGGENFYTVMSYGDSGQNLYRVFSSPNLTVCGGSPCGTSGTDNVTTLTKSIPYIARFRDSKAGTGRAYADFDGDGASDLLWRHAGNGSNAIWLSAHSATQQPMANVANSAWKAVGIGDFDGDGRADVLWRNMTTGANVIWRSGNKTTVKLVPGAAKLTWIVAGVADFDGDGTDDILWRNTVSGANVIWKSAKNGMPQYVASVTNQNWIVAGVGDFNRDLKADILWRNRVSGSGVIWLSGNNATQQSITKITNLDWRVVGIGDFNSDGVDDILWHNYNNGSGDNTIWLSANSATTQQVGAFLSPVLEVSVGDFNGDGQADIVWRNGMNGGNYLWPSAGSGQQENLTILTDIDWHIQPHAD